MLVADTTLLVLFCLLCPLITYSCWMLSAICSIISNFSG